MTRHICKFQLLDPAVRDPVRVGGRSLRKIISASQRNRDLESRCKQREQLLDDTCGHNTARLDWTFCFSPECILCMSYLYNKMHFET